MQWLPVSFRVQVPSPEKSIRSIVLVSGSRAQETWRTGGVESPEPRGTRSAFNQDCAGRLHVPAPHANRVATDHLPNNGMGGRGVFRFALLLLPALLLESPFSKRGPLILISPPTATVLRLAILTRACRSRARPSPPNGSSPSIGDQDQEQQRPQEDFQGKSKIKIKSRGLSSFLYISLIPFIHKIILWKLFGVGGVWGQNNSRCFARYKAFLGSPPPLNGSRTSCAVL